MKQNERSIFYNYGRQISFTSDIIFLNINNYIKPSKIDLLKFLFFHLKPIIIPFNVFLQRNPKFRI